MPLVPPSPWPDLGCCRVAWRLSAVAWWSTLGCASSGAAPSEGRPPPRATSGRSSTAASQRRMPRHRSGMSSPQPSSCNCCSRACAHRSASVRRCPTRWSRLARCRSRTSTASTMPALADPSTAGSLSACSKPCSGPSSSCSIHSNHESTQASSPCSAPQSFSAGLCLATKRQIVVDPHTSPSSVCSKGRRLGGTCRGLLELGTALKLATRLTASSMSQRFAVSRILATSSEAPTGP
mmetsp:Transcript_72604/g.216720  ORF Transcript_72604/g.216720 Transcript_72604/m.216720 type:complete len:237 (+) Transcript_72604:1663-2373(+)